MKFPAFWAHGTAEQLDGNGKKVRFACWGASDISQEEAHVAAIERATRVLAKLLSGGRELKHYPYGNAPLREDVQQRFFNRTGELVAAVTTNAYGALVLNTARVMFADIDFSPIRPGERLRHAIGKWFERNRQSPEAMRERMARERVRQIVESRAGWGARLYRTYAGLRVLLTHDLFDPAGDATHEVFQLLGADPLYMRLCRNQQSFRARLTPKPWRCGHMQNRIPWPRQSAEEQVAFESWQTRYVEFQQGFATCRVVDVIGADGVHPDVEQVIALHDEVAKVGESLPLA